MTLLDLRRPNILAWAEETFKNAYNSNLFSDVTLITEDNEHIEAHKLVLSSSSPFFEAIFTKQNHHNLLIYLHGISHRTLKCVLEFIYLSQTKLIGSELENFMEVSRQLQIKGISENSSAELQATDTYIADYQLFKEEQTATIDEFQTTNSKDDQSQKFVSETLDEEEDIIESTTLHTKIGEKKSDRCKETQIRNNVTEETKQMTCFELDRYQQELPDFRSFISQEPAFNVQQMIENENKVQVATIKSSPCEK